MAKRKGKKLGEEVKITQEQKDVLLDRLKSATDEIEEIRKLTGVDRILVNTCSRYKAFEAVMDQGMKRVVRQMNVSEENEWKNA